MVEIDDQISIDAPVGEVFDADRNISLHAATQKHRRERAVDGVTEGLIELGQEVEWEAIHFGIRQRHRSRITEMGRPRYFRDDMIYGTFKTFSQEHYFKEPLGGQTLKTDILKFSAPYGLLGRIAEFLFLGRYMSKFIKRKNLELKVIIDAGRPGH